MLPVPLDCPLLTVPSVLSNVYLYLSFKNKQLTCTIYLICPPMSNT